MVCHIKILVSVGFQKYFEMDKALDHCLYLYPSLDPVSNKLISQFHSYVSQLCNHILRNNQIIFITMAETYATKKD